MTLHDPGDNELRALLELRNENQRLRERQGLDHGPSNGERAMVKWLLGIVASLALAGILGVVAMYREQGEVAAAVGETTRRLERLENYVYRERR